MTTTTSRTDQWLQECQQAVEQQLLAVLPSNNIGSTQLTEAMHYAVFNGGKRLRPAFVYAVGTDFNANLSQLHRAAAAIELIHCYSLVHDDLPAMDDDDLRRGKPSCHKAFDEATAILTGNALQSLAFEVLANQPRDTHEPEHILTMIQHLAISGGAYGMGGGQALDLAAEIKRPSLEELETIHALKTGALIQTSLIFGALAAGHDSENDVMTLASVAKKIGLSFQIQDDILDLTSDTETLGKHTGADLKHNKATYPSLTDLQTAQDTARILLVHSDEELDNLPFPMIRLRQLIQKLNNRQK